VMVLPGSRRVPFETADMHGYKAVRNIGRKRFPGIGPRLRRVAVDVQVVIKVE
jgi:hypothetical protein